jgi:uncharacterized protein YggE
MITRSLKTFFVLGLLLTPAAASAQRTITVIGEAPVSGQAESASIKLSVNSMGTTASQLFTSHNAEVARVRKALETAGISSKDISVERFNLTPNLEYSQMGPRLVGYRVETPITLSIPDIAQLPKILDLAQQAGANMVSGVNFSSRGKEGSKERASKEALKEARERAQDLAREIGAQLGDVISISDVEEPKAEVMGEREREMGMRPGAAADEEKVELKVVFQLK